MIFKISLSLHQVVDLVEPHLLLKLVRYLLPDPGGSHQFAQLVCTYSADGQIIYQGPFPGLSHTDHEPKWACDVYVNGYLLGRSYDHKNKEDAKRWPQQVLPKG